MVRVATQILLGLMLFFGTVTLIPRAIIYLKLGRRGRGVMYLVLGVISAVFAVIAFGYAYTALMEGY